LAESNAQDAPSRKGDETMVRKAKTKAFASNAPRKRAAAHLDGYIPTQESVGFIVREVYRAFARSLQARIAREGVTIGMWFVLRMLWDEDGLTQRELSELVGINGPAMVAAINSMEREGLVKRVPHRSDRRKVNVHLTKRGRDLRNKLWPIAADVLEIGFKGLTPAQIRMLRNALVQVRNNLDNDHFGRSVTRHRLP